MKTHDIKAPDGYVLGGRRKVRKDGTILFNRGWWQAPVEWAGETVWVHEYTGLQWNPPIQLQVAPPGMDLWRCAYHTQEWFKARPSERNIICDRTERPDAKPVFRHPDHVAWSEKNR